MNRENLKKIKIVKITKDEIIFENGIKLYSYHSTDFWEEHYLDFSNVMDRITGQIFDLSNDNFFERVPDFGIRLKPLNLWPIPIPSYSCNNGYYSDQLELVLSQILDSGEEIILKRFDIIDCQNPLDRHRGFHEDFLKKQTSWK